MLCVYISIVSIESIVIIFVYIGYILYINKTNKYIHRNWINNSNYFSAKNHQQKWF